MISVSILKSVYNHKKTIEILESNNDVEYIHLDLMDGIYVEENNFNIDDIIDTFKNTTKQLDIHLMVDNPDKYIDKLSDLNVKYITFHPDASVDPIKTINKIKNNGINAGIAIDSIIDVEKYEDIYKKADLILIMSVKAGKGGQSFLRETLSKIDYFSNLKDYEDFTLEIDGGINDIEYKKLQRYPIDIFVIGSYICENENFSRPINKLKQINEETKMYK